MVPLLVTQLFMTSLRIDSNVGQDDEYAQTLIITLKACLFLVYFVNIIAVMCDCWSVLVHYEQ